MVGEKYLRAVVDGADAYPVSLPSLADGFDVVDIIDRLDGLFLTGSPSNVDPSLYLGDPSRPGTWHDPERDVAAMALIPAAIRVGMPVLAVCRGFQEVNVSLGGSLHQYVHEIPGYHVHKEDPDDTLEEQYGPSHTVNLVEGGELARIINKKSITVNSLHSQGVDRLSDELVVEARADDGLIEAFRVKNAPGFTLAVQWHPEWQVTRNPDSMAIFTAFGDACRAYRLRDLPGSVAATS